MSAWLDLALKSSKHRLFDLLFSASATLDCHADSPITDRASLRPWVVSLRNGYLTAAFWLALGWCGVMAVLCWPMTLLCWLCYDRVYCRPPRLFFQKTARNISLLKYCPTLREKISYMMDRYRPSPFTVWPFPFPSRMSGHLQTLCHELVRGLPVMTFDRQYLDTGDGGLLALDFYALPEFNADTPMLLVLHGLTGGSHTQYVRHLVRILEQNGVRPIVMNARGCSNSPLKTTKYFNCGYTDDVRLVVRHLKSLYPNAPFMAAAFSLGANILTKYVGEEGASCQLDAAITMANPFDWLLIDDWLRKPLNKHLYNFILTKSLLSYLKRHRDVFVGHESVEIDKLLRDTWTLQDYDEKITTKLWGYESTRGYYRETSGKHWIPHIRIPFLVIQALDDPIVPETVIPWESILKNPNVILVATEIGGHMAWLEGWAPTENNWADRVSMEFVHSVLDHMQAASMVDL